MSLHILICIKNKYSYFFQIAQKGNFIQTKKFAMKIAQLKISFWYLLMKWGSKKLLRGFVSHKLTAYLSVFNLFLTQWIMAILSKECKPDNLEPQNSLNLSLTNIWGFCTNFVECESFLESNFPDILALCETNLDDSTDSENYLWQVIFL